MSEPQRPDPPSAGLAAEDATLRVRVLGYLFLAGATIGLVSLLLPVPPEADVAGLYSNVGLAYAGGALLLAGARWVRTWMLHVALAAGTVLITRAVLLSGDTVSFYSVWFIWVGMYAFCFFRPRAAAAHMALVCALYAATLVHDPPSSPVARWLTTVSTLIVAGVFIGNLVRRIRDQAHEATCNARDMAQLTELAHELATISDGPSARTALSAGALRVMSADGCALWEASPGGLRAKLTASAGTAPGAGEIVLEADDCGPATAFRTGRHAIDRVPPTQQLAADRRHGASAARLWQPIVQDSRTIAVLELSWTHRAPHQESATVAVTRLLAVEAAVTLQRVELLETLERTARTDELTGLPNRRAWHERFPAELARASRAQQSVSVAMIDLDHFKHYNDSHGHRAGDWLLKQAASLWGNELRETDLLARYGGEEFALALPACGVEQAVDVIERFRAVIPNGQSCSAGVASWDGSEVADELLHRADQALYDAKRTGRNRTSIATSRQRGTAVETPRRPSSYSVSPGG